MSIKICSGNNLIVGLKCLSLPGLIFAKIEESIDARESSNAVGQEKAEGLQLEGRVAADEQGPDDRVGLVRVRVQEDEAVRMFKKLPQDFLN